MTLSFQYTLLYLLVCIVLFWGIIKYGSYVCNYPKLEGLTNFDKYSQMVVPYPSNALIDYNNLNLSEYSHTVNMPIVNGDTCKNFCGPQAQCALTRGQCTSDVDCPGCNPGVTPQSECVSKEVPGYDATGKLGYNQSLQYSSLTTGYNNHNADFAQIYPDSKDAKLTRPYEGVDTWEKSFNKGLELYNKRQTINDKYINDQMDFGFLGKKTYYEPKYPLTISPTSLFYETTPPASNASIG